MPQQLGQESISFLRHIFCRTKGPALAGAILLALAGCDPQQPTEAVEGRLVVSQLLYRSGIDTLEWIEIRNTGLGEAKLAGVEIKAIDYRFSDSTPALAPGKHVLLTNSEALFAKHYPGVRIHGLFTGRLADQGEKVKLSGVEGEGFEFSYADREPWPVGAATVGASLVYLGGDPALASSWAASALPGEAPRTPAATAFDKGIRISEVRPADDSAQGFVELASLSESTVDLSGWIVASSKDPSRADTLPTGTSIPAHGRLVLRQSPGPMQLGWGSLLPLPTGGELLLLERDAAGRITGNVHSLAWDFIPPGFSAARIGAPEGAGDVALSAYPSPGAADPQRALGPVTISEVCYAPTTGEAEFVELLNETDSVIHLGDSDTSRAWSLTGTGKVFASTDSIPARGRLVLVSEVDATPAAFRARWSISSQVPILGYSGRLDNAGETLRLEAPWLPIQGNNGSTAWAVRIVDAAGWLPSSPWPTSANGGGACLVRTDKTLPGTSSMAWVAAQPTPGN